MSSSSEVCEVRQAAARSELGHRAEKRWVSSRDAKGDTTRSSAPVALRQKANLTLLGSPRMVGSVPDWGHEE